MPYRDPEYFRNYARKYYLHRRRQNRLRAVQLLGGKCFSCSKTNPEELEFSHELGPKLIPAKNLWTLSWTRIETEILKCRLRCATCHASIDPFRAQTFNADPTQKWDDEVPF